jgi:Tol biopolymer transport system component
VDMRLPEHDPIILTQGPGDWESPSWAADGRHLVCSRTLDGQTRLMLVDTYYGKTMPLKTGASQESLPTYSRR